MTVSGIILVLKSPKFSPPNESCNRLCILVSGLANSAIKRFLGSGKCSGIEPVKPLHGEA